jgi:hypothetical protein
MSPHNLSLQTAFKIGSKWRGTFCDFVDFVFST